MLLTLAVQMGVMGLVLGVTLALQGARFDVPMVKAVWLLFVNVMVVTSIAVFFSAFSSPFLSGFFAFGCFVVGRSVPDIRAVAERMGGAAKALISGATHFLLDLHLFSSS